MQRKQRILLVLLAAAAAFVGVLALRNPQPPMLPPNDEHAAGRAPEGCLDCHGPSGAVPRTANHPLGQDCLRCHGRR